MNYDPFKKKPAVPELLPDLGMHYFQDDIMKSVLHHFYGLPIDHIYFVGDPVFSLCLNTSLEGQKFCLSIDLTMDEAVNLLKLMGHENINKVMNELQHDDTTPRKIELPQTVQINFVCSLGEPIKTLNEMICPFIPVDISI